MSKVGCTQPLVLSPYIYLVKIERFSKDIPKSPSPSGRGGSGEEGEGEGEHGPSHDIENDIDIISLII